MENLYGWLFTFNYLTGLWKTTTRDHYMDLFSNEKSKFVLQSSEKDTLIDIVVNKLKGDIDKIPELESILKITDTL